LLEDGANERGIKSMRLPDVGGERRDVQALGRPLRSPELFAMALVQIDEADGRRGIERNSLLFRDGAQRVVDMRQ